MAHRSSHIQQVSKSNFAEHPLCSYHTPGKVYQLCTTLSFHLYMFGWTLISPHRCIHGPGSMIAKLPGVRQQCYIKNTQKVSLNLDTCAQNYAQIFKVYNQHQTLTKEEINLSAPVGPILWSDRLLYRLLPNVNLFFWIKTLTQTLNLCQLTVTNLQWCQLWSYSNCWH